MYNVLLVDDERIILEGIASVVEWERLGTCLVGKAIDGKEALQYMERYRPHIVITDIRMPEINGIELVKMTMEKFPETIFIILSGHEEFSSAQAAMKYGIRHYLTKPCNENQIMQVLSEAVAELKERERKEQFLAETRGSIGRLLPQIREQFLKECITNKTYGQREWDYYSRLLELDIFGESLRLLLFEVEGGTFEYEHLFALHNIAEEMIGRQGRIILLNTTIGGRLVLLVEEGALPEWMTVLGEIKEVYAAYFKLDLTVAISSPGSIKQIRKLYNETLECLSHRFYLGEGSLITIEDIRLPGAAANAEATVIDHDRFALAVRSGNLGQAAACVKEASAKLKQSKQDISIVKSYIIELYLILIRQSGEHPGRNKKLDQSDILESYLLRDNAFGTLDQAEMLLLQAVSDVTLRNYESNMQSQNRMIERVIRHVHEHLDDETLSLTKLAQEIFYINVDYLGKLFRKETGEKFSNYVIYMRMEEAKRLIRQAEQVKILDIAAKVGFRSNPQYFSQVFKRHTGCTPSEFKRKSGLKIADF